MRLSRVGELALLEKVRAAFHDRARGVVAGIGDDAAVLRFAGKNLLVTSDMMLEGVHFDLRFITPFQLGFKLISVNVSDIYAMGGRPSFALLDIAASGDTEDKTLDRLFEGVRAASDAYGASVVGGDISSSPGGLVLSATILGHASRPVLRAGARPGDRIYVTGSLGESACGLALLKKMGRPVELERPVNRPLKWEIMRPLLKKHLMPEAREPSRFARGATSMIDLSDGLLIDLTRLCDESRVGARLYTGRIPVSGETRTAAAFLGLDPQRLASAGGEDYELLFTAPSRTRVGAHCIGEIIGSGRFMVDEQGVQRPMEPEGYEHFKE
jgi:thiamine-monophosphate kinase